MAQGDRKAQLARELSQIAIASLAAATGGLFIEAAFAAPAAAGAATALGRFLDRIKLGPQAESYVDDAQTALLQLGERYPEQALDVAFETARSALLEHGLSARRFAQLDFDPRRAAEEVARVSGWPVLAPHDKEGNPNLAFHCLQTLYDSFVRHRDNTFELERAFQKEALTEIHRLGETVEEFHPLAEALDWRHLLEIPSARYTPDASVTILLSPRCKILPYQQRVEDETFTPWLEDSDPRAIAISVVQGKGGSGKTRWLLEQCERRDSAWRVGFLVNESAPGDQQRYTRMLSGAAKVLVVVDYAEDRLEQVVTLLSAAERALDQGAKHIRIILLTRNLTDQWWDSLRIQLPDRSRGWVERGSKILTSIPLQPLAAPQTRGEMFEAALRVLRPYVDDAVEQIPTPDLSAHFYGDPLYIQLAALSLLRGSPLPMSDRALLDSTLDHEAKYWVGDGVEREHVEPLLAVATFWQGLDGQALKELIEQWPDPVAPVTEASAVKVAQRLTRLYPGEGGTIAPLVPDRLGERLIMRVLAAGMDSIVKAAFGPQVEGERLKSAFNIITRMPMSELEQLVKLGRALAQMLSEHDDAEFAMRLMAQLPQYSVVLAELDYAAALMVYQWFAEGGLETEIELMSFAWAANNIAVSGANVGNTKLALIAAKEAVEIRRQLVAQRPDVFAPSLAVSLNNMANRLSEVGSWGAALKAAQEALGIYRQLAERCPDDLRPVLAALLNNVSNRLSEVGDRAEALATAREAVGIRRQLVEQSPEAFGQDLAMSLSNVSNRLSEVGDREAALEAACEAVEIRRQLVDQRPDAFLPELATSLDNVAIRLSELGDLGAALVVAQEALDVRRQLAKQRPGAFDSHLAVSLNNVSNHLLSAGDAKGALAKAQEAREIYQRLMVQRPDFFANGLAVSLNNMALSCFAGGSSQLALEAAQEALAIRRVLAEQQPDVFAPELASSLGTMGVALGETTPEAIECFSEGIRLLIPYFTAIPSVHGGVMAALCKHYIEACEVRNIAPDESLLTPVLEIVKKLDKGQEE